MTGTVFEAKYVKSWSSLVAGDAVSYLPNGQSNLVIGLFPLSVLFCNFINTAAYHWADVSLNLLLAVMLPNKICWKMNWCLVHLKRIHWLCCRWTIIQTYYLPTYLPTLISNEMQVWRYGRHCNKMSHINRSWNKDERCFMIIEWVTHK